MTDWEKACCNGADKPAALDTTSSQFFVYQRKNIKLINFEYEGNTFEIWQYEERKLTKDEYARMREAELEEELTQTQLALTEIYESLVVNNG